MNKARHIRLPRGKRTWQFPEIERKEKQALARLVTIGIRNVRNSDLVRDKEYMCKVQKYAHSI